jgi:hypothetical protein
VVSIGEFAMAILAAKPPSARIEGSLAFGSILFGLILLLLLRTTLALYRRFPVELGLDPGGAHFSYASGAPIEFGWSNRGNGVYLYDLRQRTKFQDVSYPLETWLATKYGGTVAPMTVEAFDAFVSTAKEHGVSIRAVEVPSVAVLWATWSSLGTLYRVGGSSREV